MGIAVLVVFALGALTTSASAVTFLLALWLFNGAPVTSVLLIENTGELELADKNAGGLGVTIKILCSRTLIGWVGPESLEAISEILNLAKESISSTELSGLALECANTENCGTPLFTLDNIPWESEAELMIEGTEEFFVDLRINTGFYVECTVLGVKVAELCEVSSLALELRNETTGVDATFSDALQTLSGGKLATCTGGGAETGEASGLETIVDPEPGTLSVSE